MIIHIVDHTSTALTPGASATVVLDSSFWLMSVRTVVMTRVTLAGTDSGLIQKDTQDRITMMDDGRNTENMSGMKMSCHGKKRSGK